MSRIVESLYQKYGLNESNDDWTRLSGADQTAVELALNYIKQGGMAVEEAAKQACADIANGNTEPEFEDEDFYQEEPNFNRVYKYLRQSDLAEAKLKKTKHNKLNEGRWNYNLKCGAALRNAIEDENHSEVLQQLLNAYKELLDAGLIDESDYESYTADFDMYLYDDFADWDDPDDVVNYELDDFYDLCDNIGVWVSLNESIKLTKLSENIKLNESGGADLYYIVKLLASKYDVSYNVQKFMDMGVSFDTRRYSFVINGLKATIVEKPIIQSQPGKDGWPIHHLTGREYRLIINRKSTPSVFWDVDKNSEFPKDEFFDYIDELLKETTKMEEEYKTLKESKHGKLSESLFERIVVLKNSYDEIICELDHSDDGFYHLPSSILTVPFDAGDALKIEEVETEID